MVTAGDFRNGVTFEMDGGVYSIIEFQHVKPGKGAAFVRTKIRNVITGAVTEKTFNPNDKYPTAYIERKDMQYLYSDGDLYYFMDNETYEQIPINASVLSDNFKFVKENMDCKVLSYKGNVFGVEPPNFVELEVTKTEPGVKGDTATNTLKPATLVTRASSLTTSSSSRRTWTARCSPTRTTSSAWSPPTLWSWRSPRPSPASAATPPPTP
ncbi:elongation factor P [Clostridium sp. CAG:1013]|nr:elongation factor P [Clostridium sp. CAG:1013]